MIVEIETSTTQCELWIPQYGINKTCYTWFPSLLGTGQYEMSGVLQQPPPAKGCVRLGWADAGAGARKQKANNRKNMEEGAENIISRDAVTIVQVSFQIDI